MSGLEFPEQRWDVVHVDFVTDLQSTKEGIDTILTCTDRVSRFTYLIAEKKSDDAVQSARRFFVAVFGVHGLPLQIISDRDTRWVAGFFKELMGIMKIKQKMGTSYDHKFNGLAENVKKTVEIMLRRVISGFSEREFTDFLPMCQYAYNTSEHSTTCLLEFPRIMRHGALISSPQPCMAYLGTRQAIVITRRWRNNL